MTSNVYEALFRAEIAHQNALRAELHRNLGLTGKYGDYTLGELIAEMADTNRVLVRENDRLAEAIKKLGSQEQEPVARVVWQPVGGSFAQDEAEATVAADTWNPFKYADEPSIGSVVITKGGSAFRRVSSDDGDAWIQLIEVRDDRPPKSYRTTWEQLVKAVGIKYLWRASAPAKTVKEES